jgi:hypothetical protein
MNQKAAPDRREPREGEGYVAPALEVLGSLEQLTLGTTITFTVPISPIRGY